MCEDEVGPNGWELRNEILDFHKTHGREILSDCLGVKFRIYQEKKNICKNCIMSIYNVTLKATWERCQIYTPIHALCKKNYILSFKEIYLINY